MCLAIPLCGVALCAAGAVFQVALTAVPQNPEQTADLQPPTTAAVSTAAREPLAQYVPIEAGFYVRLSNCRAWQDMFNAAGAGEGLDGMNPLGALGLMSEHVAIAAPTWRKHNTAVTVCQPGDPTQFAHKLQLDRAKAKMVTATVQQYERPGSMSIATNGRVFVFSQSTSAMFKRAVRLLAQDGRSLLDDDRFQSYVRRSSEDNAGIVFVDEDWRVRQGAADSSETWRPKWLPSLESIGAELFLERQRIVCRVLANRRDHELPLPNAVYPAQLKMLPPSTLAAWTQLVSAERVMAELPKYISKGESLLYWHVLRALLESDLSGDLPLREIGPRATMCVLGGEQLGRPPRVGLVIEAAQAEAVSATIVDVVRNVGAVMKSQQGGKTAPIRYVAETFQNETIHQFALSEGLMAGETLLGTVRPAICAVNQQLLLGSDSSVVREMITARASGLYAHPPFKRWVETSKRGGDDSQLRVFMDLLHTAPHLQHWQRSLTSKTLHSSPWFQGLRNYWQDSPVRLGARLRNDQPGKVFVLRVLEDHPAAWARLKPEDLIVGIDGQLLSLDDAIAELRAKLTGGRHRLRVERHGQIVELTIDLPQTTGKSLRGLLDNAAVAMKQLAKLAGYVDHVTYRQFGTNPTLLQAEVILYLKKASG